MTGSPKCALALLPHQQEQPAGAPGPVGAWQALLPKELQGLCRCPRPVPKFPSWSRAM